MTEWTPLDDLGRLEAGLAHSARRAAEGIARLADSRRKTLAAMDTFMLAIGDGVDWSEATDEEARLMAEALDTIYWVRGLIEDLGA